MSVQPIKPALTNKGNEYNKSNLGKYSAGATIGTGATVIAMKNIPFKSIKKPFEGFKNIDFSKIKDVKIKKPNFKNIFQNALTTIENIGTQIKQTFTNLKSLEFKKLFKKPQILTDFMSKIKKPKINKVKVSEMLKTPKAVKLAEYSGFTAGALITGLAIDYVLNKINAYKADKKA